MSASKVSNPAADIDAFIDGRLSGERYDAVVAAMDGDRELRYRVDADLAARKRLREELAAKYNEPVPAHLRVDHLQARRRKTLQARRRTWTAIAATFVLGVTGGWLGGHLGGTFGGSGQPQTTQTLTHDATGAYNTYVMEVLHPVEVNASNEAHLLQWLSKRLGRPFIAPDLARFGYRLMGGRLLPGNAGAAAQLMYDDASGRRLTVYVQASQGNETAFQYERLDGASTFAWVDQGFGFAVTGNLGRDALLQLAEAVYKDYQGDQTHAQKA